mgnify:CR=1 FL=1
MKAIYKLLEAIRVFFVIIVAEGYQDADGFHYGKEKK